MRKIKKRKKKITKTQRMKKKARRTLNGKVSEKSIKVRKNYVVDTSIIINRFLSKLIAKGIRGKIIIPNAVIAELENLANKGNEAGFIGLEEIAKLHKLKQKHPISVLFEGIRPQIIHIKYAKSGEIDALIRNIAVKYKAVLVTADLVQAKSAQAYGLEVIFLRPPVKRKIKPKKRFLSFLKKKRR